MTARSVLVVDDDRRCVEALCLRLDHAGYRSLRASSGREAMAAYDAHTPDAILLDASMPDVGGFDVCRHVRASDPDRTTKVIIVSGASAPSEDYIARCVQAHDADGYVRKPFAFEDVRTLLERLLTARTNAEGFG